jgi:hypothetical protein
VTGWREYLEEHNNLYSLWNIINTIISRIRWAEHVAWTTAEEKISYKMLVIKRKERRFPASARSRWENNIITDLKEIVTIGF